MQRAQIIAHYKENPHVSVLIIGAGINGLGTFRDLALQDIDVLVVDRGDFCSGTSAASSRMVHGGIRYLENGEFRLVREAVHERNRLLKNAPHYVKPLPTTIPIFKRFSGLLNAPLKFLNLINRPSERGAAVIKAGLVMYDGYTKEQGNGVVPKHEFIGRNQSLAKFPQLNPDIKYTATYYDAAMRDAERLAIEVMLDGVRFNRDAHALNYVSAVGAAGDSVMLHDEETDDTFLIKPQIVINAAGPWIDFHQRGAGLKDALSWRHKRVTSRSRSSRIARCLSMATNSFLSMKMGASCSFTRSPGASLSARRTIAIDNPDEVEITDAEIGYFLEFIKVVFPDIEVDPGAIVYTFTGVRPLPASDAETTGQISQRSSQYDNRTGLSRLSDFNMIGGKLD